MLAPNPQALMTMPAPKFHDVTVRMKKTRECARVMPVPPEEFGIASAARTIKDSGYCYHATPRKASDLVAEGYDEGDVSDMPTFRNFMNSEETSRDTVDENLWVQTGDNNATRLVLLIEHYIELDYEGSGKTALYRICTNEHHDILTRDGEQAIYREEAFPFVSMTPVVMTHRFWGRSIADLVMDIQRIKTALTRGLLDNIYARNNFRTEVAESFASDNTLDDLMVRRHDGIVRTKQPGGLTPLTVEDVSPAIYPALQYFDATREWRTGVSRQGQGVDPNALQNQVATIANQMEAMSDKKIKLIARIFAETGIRDLFALLHATIRKHGQKAQTVRLRNTWVQIDPRDWRERNDLTIKVGLGNGNKAQQMAGIQMLIQSQVQGIQAGLVSRNNLWHTAQALCRTLGYPDATEFFVDPNQQPQDQASAPIPPPPDPKQAEMQQKAQADQAKLVADAAHQKMKIEQDSAIEQTKMQHQLAIEQLKSQNERDIAMLKAQLEATKIEHEARHKERELALKAAQHDQQHAQSAHEFNQQHALDHAAKAAEAHTKHMEFMSKAVERLTADKKVTRDQHGRVEGVTTVQ